MGREFARRCLRAGVPTALEDVLPSKLRLAEEEIAAEGLDASEAGLLRMALTVEDAVRDADLAIDFMPDDLESKLEIFSMLDRMAPPHTILCTPTDRLSLTDLASCTYRPERCVAVRGDFAGEQITLVHGSLTAPASIEAARAWLEALGYTVRLAEDVEEPMLVKNARTNL